MQPWPKRFAVALEVHFSGHIGPDAMSAHRHRETECEVMITFEGFTVGSITRVRAVRDVIDEAGEEIARKGDLGEVIEVFPEDFMVNVRWDRTGYVYAPDAALDIVPVLE